MREWSAFPFLGAEERSRRSKRWKPRENLVRGQKRPRAGGWDGGGGVPRRSAPQRPGAPETPATPATPAISAARVLDAPAPDGY